MTCNAVYFTQVKSLKAARLSMDISISYLELLQSIGPSKSLSSLSSIILGKRKLLLQLLSAHFNLSIWGKLKNISRNPDLCQAQTWVSWGKFFRMSTNTAIPYGCIYFPCVKLNEKSMKYWQINWCECSGMENLILKCKPLTPGCMQQ